MVFVGKFQSALLGKARFAREQYCSHFMFCAESELMIRYGSIRGATIPENSAVLQIPLWTKYNRAAGDISTPDAEVSDEEAVRIVESLVMFERIQEELSQQSPELSVNAFSVRTSDPHYLSLGLELKKV